MIIMVALGMGIFLGFNIQWNSLESNAFGFLDDTEYADYRVYSESGFSEEDVSAIQGIDGVDAATRYFSAKVEIKGTDDTLTLNVSENYTVSTMLVTSGKKYDESSNGIWISDKYAEANGISLGDSITIACIGKEITAEVVGVCKSGENLICVADENQLMPDFETHGFAYVTPDTLENALGFAYYPQVNLISDIEKAELEEAIKNATGKTLLVSSKEEHLSYAGVMSEAEEGKTMGSILPMLFLAIAILTMVTTMHRISANEKVQIGTLKSLGFRDKKILAHYTSYGFLIGLIGTFGGVGLGYLVAGLIISPTGTMSTYIDMPEWRLYMPAFCIPILAATLIFLILIGFLSVKRMLKGTAADALRPYTPKAMKKSVIEKLPFWEKLSFGTKWNIRDILRHKARSAMTLVGVFGCMLLLVGGLGMKDTMVVFLDMLDRDISNYETKVSLPDATTNEEAKALALELNGDWQATNGISYEGNTISLEIYDADKEKIRFLSEENELMTLGDDGVYLCLRLKDTANIGDTIEFSPYGSEKTYQVKVAGYFRSLVSECIVMSDTYADKVGVEYHIGTIYTDVAKSEIANYSPAATSQDKTTIMDTYDTFMEIMNVMILILVFAA
ncbi:MAG: ABC transporter permease, partial [Clostridia bacterium]|nr:ABC transporter permease [Clostridia bacterium]